MAAGHKPESREMPGQPGVALFTEAFADAQCVATKIAQIWLTCSAREHSVVATSLDTISRLVYAPLKNYAQAEKLYQQALKIRDAEDACSLPNLALVEAGFRQGTSSRRFVQDEWWRLPATDPKPLLREYAELLRKCDVRGGFENGAPGPRGAR